jgi:hypothetical protein
MAEAGVARIHDFLKFRPDRLRIAISHWVHSDRLPMHPIDIEASHGVQRRLALRAGPEDQKYPARRIGADRARTGGEAFEQTR